MSNCMKGRNMEKLCQMNSTVNHGQIGSFHLAKAITTMFMKQESSSRDRIQKREHPHNDPHF